MLIGLRVALIGCMSVTATTDVIYGWSPRMSGEEEELDDFRSGEYASADLDSRFPQTGEDNDQSSKTKEEDFVAMIGDVLKMRRSLCVHRNFQVAPLL